jgi:ABC-type branched-subunit amino acid transport system ATPase component/ABC-type branched-subunit amino acid transport system permease subunit
MLPFVIAGLTTGSLFALAAVGLVLTYKTSGVFNFAQGALASVAAYLFYFLRVQHGLPWPVAALLAMLVAGPGLGLVIERVTRTLAGVRLPVQVLATVGLTLVIQGALNVLYPPGPYREVPQFLPSGSFSLFGFDVQYFRVVIAVAVLVIVVFLAIYLRRSRTGLAMQAVVDNPQLLAVVGTNPTRVRRTAWMIGSSFAALTGVLLAPLLPLDVTSMTSLVVTAFGAAAIGGFTSLPLTYIGGLAIGVGQSLLDKWTATSTGFVSGLSSSLPFLVLFAVLVAAPSLRQPSGGGARRLSTTKVWRAPRAVRVPGVICFAVLLLLVPQFAGAHLFAWTQFLAFIMVFLSLGLLVRLSGQVSLAHITFMAIGAAAFSHLAVDHHVPWLVAVLLAGLIAAPIGAVLAIPAIRFPGLYLALATLGFGILVEYMFYPTGLMFGQLGLPTSIPLPRLSWLGLNGSASSFYYVVLVFVAVTALVVAGLVRGRLGRLLSALGDSPTGVASCGASVNVTRVVVFCLSASIAAVAGVLYSGATGVVGGDNFDPLVSLQLFVLVMIAGGGPSWYAVVAAAGQVLIPAYISTGQTVQSALTLLFGFGALFMTVLQPDGMTPPPPLVVQGAVERLGRALKFDPTMRWLPRRSAPAPASQAGGRSIGSSTSRSVPNKARPHTRGLRADEITVRFGGVVAVDNVSVEAPPARVTAVIGPNGAGKTTLFNACSGWVRPTNGVVELDGRRLNRLGPAARARSGIGRTFQRFELFDSLTVRRNVELGCEGAFAGPNPISHVVGTRGQAALIRSRADDAMRFCELLPLSDSVVGSLSTGQRRVVELARCIAGGFEMLLLDEPSSGLDPFETHRFVEMLRALVTERGTGILLVEHDLDLIQKLSDYVYVLDFGRQIFDGDLADLNRSEVVRAAYIGGHLDAEVTGSAGSTGASL